MFWVSNNTFDLPVNKRMNTCGKITLKIKHSNQCLKGTNVFLSLFGKLQSRHFM